MKGRIYPNSENFIGSDGMSESSKANKEVVKQEFPKNYKIALWVFGGVVILGSTIYILNKIK